MTTTTLTPMMMAPAIDAGGVSLLDKLDRFVSSSSAGVEQARVYPVTIPGASRLPPTKYDDDAYGITTTVATPVIPSTVLTTIVQTDDFVVLPGPEDVLLLNTTTGLYQQSVTLTARMYPIEATAAKSIWGLPTLIWGILIGTVVILLLILATLFFCCWLQPRTRKLLNSSYYTTTTNNGNASQSSIVAKSCTSSSDSNQLVMPLSIGICPPQYSAPPPPQQSQQSQGTPQSHHGSTGGSNSSLHHASHGASVHHTCNAVQSSQSGSVPIGGVCNMASGSGHDYAHVKYGSSPQQQQAAILPATVWPSSSPPAAAAAAATPSAPVHPLSAAIQSAITAATAAAAFPAPSRSPCARTTWSGQSLQSSTVLPSSRAASAPATAVPALSAASAAAPSATTATTAATEGTSPPAP
ncbi:hypothetical protein AND_008567 [Anopheles darlingi]|uniref:Uncharacterized protein n=1 Tax=Anopheles darlingi TaxID=43151 RepID=W5J8W4_ANODA|nr:hypothetical protein AND_008567 [Anopheles darlingi]